MEKVKIATVIILIIIIIIIFLMIILLRNNNNFSNKESDLGQTEFETIDLYESQGKIIQVNNRNKYYSVEKILNTYIYYIKEMKGIIDFQKYDDNEIKNEGVSKLYNILDKQYISEMHINKENIQEKIKEFTDYNLQINKMYIYEMTSSINIYFVDFSIDNNALNLLIKTDSKNMTFSVFLDDFIKEKSLDITMNIQNLNISDDEIEINNYNKYKYLNISDEYMAMQYMNSLKYYLNNNIEYLYNNLMEQEYRDKRFGNIENYQQYINENKNEFKNIIIKKYFKNNYDGYTEYVCQDQYENLYIFREKAIMDYELILDTYTIDEQTFIEEYQKATDEKKVQMNIDKFIQMINRHDYRTSYNCISEGFKNNYFNTQEQFENFIKNNFFTYNKFEFKNIEKKGSNLYVCTVNFTDLTGQSTEIKQINVIMQLNGNLDFKMSFGV